MSIYGGDWEIGGVFYEESLYNGCMKLKNKNWIVRGLIGIVVFFNLDAAFSFMIKPALYSPGFELNGVPGQAIVQGMGILFLMWNVPYLVAMVNPQKHFISLVESVIMQAIGVSGESIILLMLQEVHPLIKATTLRFIVFDGGGLVFLLIALWITWKNRKALLVK
jgi:hypothetical protein